MAPENRPSQKERRVFPAGDVVKLRACTALLGFLHSFCGMVELGMVKVVLERIQACCWEKVDV